MNVIRDFYERHPAFGINSLRRRKVEGLIERELSRGARSILDVGCAGGYVTAKYRDRGLRVVGIDIAEHSVVQARQTLGEAYQADIEGVWPPAVTEQRFDIVLAAEVIEHLFDPAAFLLKVSGVLAPNGVVIITTPNFLVWNDRAEMLLGTYRFLDHGHIRLFSHRTFRDLVTAAGWSVISEDHLWLPPALERFRAWLPPNLFVYQIICACRPRPDVIIPASQIHSS